MWTCVLLMCIVLGTVRGYNISAAGEDLCADNCTCKHVTMKCVAVPVTIPSHIQNVVIIKTGDELYRLELDDRSGWQHVMRVEINAQKLYLESSAMASCRNLTHLKIHITGTFIINTYAFNGLDSLVELDLSGNRELSMDNLLLALQPPDKQNILQNLKTLNIRRIQSAFIVSITLNETFFKAVTAGRYLKQIDISETNIGVLEFSQIDRFCETVETLIAQNCTMASASNYSWRPPCRSLRTLDLSGTYIPITRQVITFITARFSCLGMRIFFSVQNLVLNNLINDGISPIAQIGQVENYHLNMATCNWNLTRILIRNNNIRLLNMTVTLSSTMEKFIQYIDISYNILEYIHPSVISPSKNMQYLDLSHNRLHIMQNNHYQEFNVLFRALLNLKHLNLSHNELTNLQADILQQTRKLETLNLANNNLTSITFTIEHLVNLRYLNLRSNNIHFLDAHFFRQFDTFTSKLDNEKKGKVLFDISDNTLICGCDDKYVESIEWILTTDVIDREESDYTCIMEEQTWNIDQTTVSDLNHHCLMKTVKFVLLVGVPTIISILVVSIITKMFVKKWYVRQQTFKETLLQINNGLFPWKYLAFVSFCSENEATAREHIIPQLVQTIEQITETDRELVSVGDIHIRPGFPIRSELVECILNSAVTIIIVSNAYCQKQCCQIEVDESYNLNKPIILIMLEKVEPHQMGKTLTKIFQQYTHASWIHDENGGHLQPNVTHIVNAMITLASNNKKYFQTQDATDIELQLQ